MTENKYWNEAKSKFIETDMQTFKLWNSTLSVPLYSPFQFEQNYGIDLIAKLKTLSDLERKNWFQVLREPFLGHNQSTYNQVRKRLQYDNDLIECSPWTIKSAHHILSYNIHTNRNFLDYDQIVEFGPGIGETCRMINDLGFKGTYYLYDLPEVLRISSFYNAEYPNVKTATIFSDIPNDKKTLFIGTWSISEVPPDYRDEVFTHFKDSDFLLIYQKEAFEYDNNLYFNYRFKDIIKKEFKTVKIDWLDHIAGGNYYLFNM
jgi:hypothetical protein